MSRPHEPETPLVEREEFDLRRLRRAVLLDALPDIASNPTTPAGGFVQALADELGVPVEELPLDDARRANEEARMLVD